MSVAELAPKAAGGLDVSSTKFVVGEVAGIQACPENKA